MNPELKEKWVAALRSGIYEQGRGYLSRENKFCCLGVLCDVAGLEYTTSGDDIRAYESGGKLKARSLPLDFSKEQGFLTASGELPNNGVNLSEMNDTGFTFREIADVIERSEI